ncbi:MAG: bifunctional aspartate kinase/homoserine dehydrogenase I [Flavobacteriales bacterium]
MQVIKFGGTSISSAKNIENILEIIKNYKTQTVVIFSAFGGVTDLLIEAGNLASKQNKKYLDKYNLIKNKHIEICKSLFEIKHQSKILSYVQQNLNNLESILEGIFNLKEFSHKSSETISGFGELMSYYVIGELGKSRGLDFETKDSREIITTKLLKLKNSHVDFELTTKKWNKYIVECKKRFIIMPGYVASDNYGNSITLGRGGSDYSASIIASICNANQLDIWTDVSGMFTANPLIVKQAISIDALSYQEAMELSHFGAKVIYPPTIQPVMNKNITITIKNTFKPFEKGTIISNKNNSNLSIVKGISHIENLSLLTLEGSGMIGSPGFSKKLFEVLSNENINIIMITQASSEHSICIGIKGRDSDYAKSIIDQEFNYEIQNNIIKPIKIESNLAIIALVGDKMKNHQGISGKMFNTLGNNNINVKAISQGASERNITAVIHKKDVKKALNTLHEKFFEKNIKQLNLFITGVGNVGKKLLEQIFKQKEYLENKLKLQLKIVGISNSKNMIFNSNGIELSKWPTDLKNGEIADPSVFMSKSKELNLRNSIFIDNTASDVIASKYEFYLKNSISVVTCNKIACADSYSNYQSLKDLAHQYSASFLFETNVGAGLPIIDTLNNLVASGDKIISIQAVLSGSLNYIFNNFKNENTFHEIVKNAMNEGYTEPDPKIDLSGIDVARKILILARESGEQIELSDVKNSSFLPEKCLKSKNNDDFLISLQNNSLHFNNILKKANKEKCKIKYIAEFNNGKAKVGLKNIPQGHDFYNLEGSDNIVLFYTDRYCNQPLIVKGAGAGSEVTAAGIFADIIRISKQ